VSFWLSYRAARLTKMVSAAEKRTQAHSILVGALLEAEELLLLSGPRNAFNPTSQTRGFAPLFARVNASVRQVRSTGPATVALRLSSLAGELQRSGTTTLCVVIHL